MKTSKHICILILIIVTLPVLVSAQLPSYLPTNGLVAWYPFNGNANDESGNGNDGVVNGALISEDRFGNSQNSYVFDGINDFIEVANRANLNTTNSSSISLWIFPQANVFYPICKSNGTSGHYRISGNFQYIDHINNGTFYSFNQINGNILPLNWCHIVMIYENLNCRLYLNGAQILGNGNPLFGNQSIDLETSISIGKDPWGATEYHYGKVDDIAIYNRALSAAEVSALYNATATNTGGGTTTTTTAPPGIPYQAEVRNDSGEVLANANVNVRFTLHELTANGTISYQETHALTTNELGLFATSIGAGTATQGTFAGINWSQTTKFLQVEVDTGNGYITMGNQQLMSVPYALYAANGPAGPQGPAGADGQQGAPGANGLSAYEIWLAQGNNGTEADFLTSITTNVNSNLPHSYFLETGTGNHTFTVPQGVETVEISVAGSIGGSGGSVNYTNYFCGGGAPGNFGFTRFTLPVNSGDLLDFNIGANGSDGYSAACFCSAGNGSNGAISTLSKNNQVILTISGSGGGVGGCRGCVGNNPCTGGQQGIAGIISFSNNFISSGGIFFGDNFWSIQNQQILIRY